MKSITYCYSKIDKIVITTHTLIIFKCKRGIHIISEYFNRLGKVQIYLV